MLSYRLALVSLLLLCAGCGGSDELGEPLEPEASEPPPTTFGGDRPVELQVPASYDPAEPAPLLILLHGLGASGELQEILFGLAPVAEEHGMLYAHPDGTFDSAGRRFWNATDLCCDFDGTGIDDSGYLRGVIDEIAEAYNVDPKRIYLSGHSNGHFMSYRMACDHADRIAAIAGLAGGMFADTTRCNPSEPVNVLHIHGTQDELVPYVSAAAPSVAFWADHGACAATLSPHGRLDLESSIEGEETEVDRHEQCGIGAAAELWSMQGAKHVPNLSAEFAPTLVEWLLAHPKP